MPSSTRPPTPGPSDVPQGSKRTMSDPESAPQDPKKPRRNPSAEPSTRRDSTRDTKRRRKKKKKTPVVNAAAAKDEDAQARLDERSRAPLSARNEVIRFTSPETDLPASIVPDAKDSSHTLSSNQLSNSQANTLPSDDTSEHPSKVIPSTPVRPTKTLIRRNAYPPNRKTKSGLHQRMDLSLSLPLVH